MKFTNEVKIGIMVIIAIGALIFGIRMLQGKGLFDSGLDLIVYYDDAAGLQSSSPVLLKGVQIGRVKEIELIDNAKIKVTVHIKSGYDIPVGTEAELVSPSMISSDKVINIYPPVTGTSGALMGEYDELIARQSSDLLARLGDEASPILANVNGTIGNIDSIALAVNNIMNYKTQVHLQNTFQNVDKTVEQLSRLAGELNKQTAQLNTIMGNVNRFSDNLADNNDKVTNILSNVEAATHSLTGPEIENTLKAIQNSTSEINRTLAKLNTTDGSAGMLLNDKELYNNLSNLSKSLDEIMSDIKRNPGKYLNISVFR